jgi:hypothetical protein
MRFARPHKTEKTTCGLTIRTRTCRIVSSTNRAFGAS